MQWYKYFHEVKDEMFHSTRRSRVEWYTFHLSPNENICSIARMRNIHYLFYITCTKRFKFFNKFKRKSIENDFSLSKKFKKARVPTVRGKYYADACVTLNARTAPVAFASRRVAHVIFLISLVLK